MKKTHLLALLFCLLTSTEQSVLGQVEVFVNASSANFRTNPGSPRGFDPRGGASGVGPVVTGLDSASDRVTFTDNDGARADVTALGFVGVADNNGDFVQPQTRQVIDIQGGFDPDNDRLFHGAVGRSRVEINDLITLTLKNDRTSPIGPIGVSISSIQATLFDHGQFSIEGADDTNLIDAFAEYNRDFAFTFAGEINLPNVFTSSLNIPVAADLANTRFRRSFDYEDFRNSRVQTVDNFGDIPADFFLTELYVAQADQSIGLTYHYETELIFRAVAGTETFNASADFGNTSGISGLRLFDEFGEDVTDLFEFRNSLGQELFVAAIPEPSAVSIMFFLTAIAVTRRRR